MTEIYAFLFKGRAHDISPSGSMDDFPILLATVRLQAVISCCKTLGQDFPEGHPFQDYT